LKLGYSGATKDFRIGLTSLAAVLEFPEFFLGLIAGFLLDAFFYLTGLATFSIIVF